MRTRKLHPAEAHALAEIARATSFAAHFRKGPFEAYTLEASSLAQAREHAKALDAAHGQFGRRACVYAITKAGRFPVPDDYEGR